jgi:hypothetical protein
MNRNINTYFTALFKTSGQGRRALFGSDPREDWKRLLIIFGVINLLIIIWSGYLFWQINQGNIFEVAPTSNVGADTATRNQLKKILTIYDGRESQFEALRVTKPVTVDPGI